MTVLQLIVLSHIRRVRFIDASINVKAVNN